MAAQNNPSISLASRLTAVSTKLLGLVFGCLGMRNAYRAGCQCTEFNLLHPMRFSVMRHVKSRRVSLALSARCSGSSSEGRRFLIRRPAGLSLFRGISGSSNDRRGNLLHAPESPHGSLSTVSREAGEPTTRQLSHARCVVSTIAHGLRVPTFGYRHNPGVGCALR